jgi:hypothetical protein
MAMYPLPVWLQWANGSKIRKIIFPLKCFCSVYVHFSRISVILLISHRSLQSWRMVGSSVPRCWSAAISLFRESDSDLLSATGVLPMPASHLLDLIPGPPIGTYPTSKPVGGCLCCRHVDSIYFSRHYSTYLKYQRHGGPGGIIHSLLFRLFVPTCKLLQLRPAGSDQTARLDNIALAGGLPAYNRL